MAPSVYPILLRCVICLICVGLCTYTEMLGMCVLYVSFGSKVRHITFVCVAMGSAVLFILKVYFEVQIALKFCRVWSEQSASCFVRI